MKHEEKAAFRRQLRMLRPERDTIARESQQICRWLLAWPEYQRATCLAAYMPLAHEADITPLLSQALKADKQLMLPRIVDGEMRFYWVKELSALRTGAFGIREPAPDAPQAALEQATLILTPLEAVDALGHRLGKGGGYYDRALRTRKGFALGVALHYQVVERVPTADWDVPLDGWVAPEGIHILTKAR